MNKAILVIDMPNACCECPINFWNHCGVLEHNRKFSGIIENPSTERLDGCPLNPVPEKYEIDKIKDPFYECQFEYGYNHCIDEILEG